jgi:hypothetical protein
MRHWTRRVCQLNRWIQPKQPRPIFCATVYNQSFKRGQYPDNLQDIKPTHIIVGAGSAGCVLANRLTEDPDNRVLLIEAGPKDNWWNWKIHMPAALMYNLCNTKYNWSVFVLSRFGECLLPYFKNSKLVVTFISTLPYPGLL